MLRRVCVTPPLNAYLNSDAGNRSGGTCASGGAEAAGPRKTVLSARCGGKAATTGRQEETPGGALLLPTTPSERLRDAE